MICDVTELLPGDAAEQNGPKPQMWPLAHTRKTQLKLQAKANMLVKVKVYNEIT